MRYQPDKYLRIYYEGVGNINYEVPASGAPGVLTAADDGLSTDAATGKIAQLGQTVGRVGNPSALTEDREIPFGGHRLFFGKDDGVSDVIGFDPSNGISISNAAGAIFEAFDSTDNFQASFTNPGEMTFDLDGGDVLLQFDDNKSELRTTRIFRTGGLRANTFVIHGPTSFNPSPTVLLFLCDTSAGNIVVNLDPSALNNNGVNDNLMVFKKTTADANTVTLLPVSGTIQEIGAPAASYVFNVQGESITVMNDGTNFYII